MATRIQYPVELIREHIQEGKTQEWIASHLVESGYDSRITAKSIYKVCRKHGIKCQRTGPRSGEGHPEWKGGKILLKSGYIGIYCPEHPTLLDKNKKREAKSNGNYYRKAKYMLEHRLVMEQKLGRYLLPSEVVHHIDNNKTNNHPDNLELFESNGEHLRETLKGQIPKWTEDGVTRMRRGNSKENRRFVAILKNAIHRESGEDAPLSRSEVARYLKKLGKSPKQACEMVSLHALPPFDDRPTH
jgi:hypothetical protein